MHNVVGHPVAGLLWVVADITNSKAVDKLADWIHESTVPKGE